MLLDIAVQLDRRTLQGYLAHKKTPNPQVHHKALGIGLLWGLRAGRVLMSKVPL
jgi:hypothetical protein